MDKRLAKRHKRQVERARARVKTSEPDVRTQEQIEADRALSQAGGGGGTGPNMAVNSRPQGHNAASTGSAARTAS